jgi:hypothetical protein
MASLKDYIQEVSDPASQRALRVLLGAVQGELAALKGTSIIAPTTLAVGSTAINVSNAAFTYRIAGMPYAKAAVAAGTALGLTGTINTAGAVGTFFGGFAAQINAAGTITFKQVAANQVYTSLAAAEVAARAIAPTAANIIIGWFVVESKADTKWTAGTDDLTPASDCTTVTYFSASAANLLTE